MANDRRLQQSTGGQFGMGTPGQIGTTTPNVAHRESIFDGQVATSVSHFGTWLMEALQDLANCPSTALDEDMAEPSGRALAKAEELLRAISMKITDRPDVYPMPDGSLAIDFRTADGKCGVFFVIEPDGSGVLFCRTKDSKDRLRVTNAFDLLKKGAIERMKAVGVR